MLVIQSKQAITVAIADEVHEGVGRQMHRYRRFGSGVPVVLKLLESVLEVREGLFVEGVVEILRQRPESSSSKIRERSLRGFSFWD